MKSHVKRIRKRRLPDQIIDQILLLIAKGKFKVGDKLPPEHILMKQFGVGRSSIREAMGALSVLGVVNVKPGHGTRITSTKNVPNERPIKWNTLRKYQKGEELIEARMVLEQAIVELAVQKANDEDIAELRNKLTYLESVKKDRKKFAQTDLSFHHSLARAGHNHLLTKFLSELHQPILMWLEREAPWEIDENNGY